MAKQIIADEIEKTELKAQLPKIDPLETYWNNKRPKAERYTYKARTLIAGSKNVPVDPRIFFTPDDTNIPTVNGKTNDEKALAGMRLVKNLITYTPDINQFKFDEEWLFAYETMFLQKGDCEDGAILIANILLKSGVPYWRIRLNAGSVKGGGHCWCTYLRESDNKWVILDWCYWYTADGRMYKDAEDYFDIWFSFNQEYIYLNEEFERDEQAQAKTKTNTRKQTSIRRNGTHKNRSAKRTQRSILRISKTTNKSRINNKKRLHHKQ